MTTDAIPKWEPGAVNVGDIIEIGTPGVKVVVVSKHKRQWCAMMHAAKSEQWRYTCPPGVGWVVIQPVDYEGYLAWEKNGSKANGVAGAGKGSPATPPGRSV